MSRILAPDDDCRSVDCLHLALFVCMCPHQHGQTRSRERGIKAYTPRCETSFHGKKAYLNASRTAGKWLVSATQAFFSKATTLSRACMRGCTCAHRKFEAPLRCTVCIRIPKSMWMCTSRLVYQKVLVMCLRFQQATAQLLKRAALLFLRTVYVRT